MGHKKLILSIAILLSSYLTCRAQIYFNNNYDEPVWVSLAYFSDSKEYKGWVTKGWFKVEPGEKKEILSYNPMGQFIYYYAQTKDAAKKFEGKSSLLVDPIEAFTIKNADKDYVKKENSKLVWRQFREIDKGLKDMLKLKYTIDFRY